MRLALQSGMVMAVLCGIVPGAEVPALKSTAVKYARISLGGDGDKAVVLAFDESRGTGQGYDRIHVIPVGFTCAAKVLKGTRSDDRVSFEPLDVEPYTKAAYTAAPLFDQFVFGAAIQSPTLTKFFLSCSTEKKGWHCGFELGQISLSSNRDDAAALTIADKVSLKLIARQASKGDVIEAGCSFMVGNSPARVSQNGKSPRMTMTVTSESGKVEQREILEAEKLLFNRDNLPYSTRVPAGGTYTVTTTSDAGPFGMLAASQVVALSGADGASAGNAAAVRYVKVSLVPDGSKALILAFEKSQATIENFDRALVIPVGFNYPTNAMTARIATESSGSIAHTFGPLLLKKVAEAAGVPVPAIDSLSFSCYQVRNADRIAVSGSAATDKNGWNCNVNNNVDYSASPTNATDIMGAPYLELAVEQKKDDNQVVISVRPFFGKLSVYSIGRNERTPRLAVVLKAKDGSVLKKTEADRYTGAGFYSYLVRMPTPSATNYTVEASVDFGPFGGVLTASQAVEVK